MNQVQNYYGEFKKFINNTMLPEINPIIKDDKYDSLSSYAYVDRDFLNLSPIHLYISSKLFTYKEQFYKSILYHEFTHIYDYYITFSSLNKEIRDKMMSIYSEYHASQIEILANIGYERAYNIFKKFSVNTKLVLEDEIVNVDKYLLFPLSSSLAIIDNDPMAFYELDNQEYSKNYVKARNNAIYYLGKFSVCEKFAKTKPYVAFHNFLEFESDIRTLYLYLKQKDYNNIIKAENDFMMHYFAYFKFKY